MNEYKEITNEVFRRAEEKQKNTKSRNNRIITSVVLSGVILLGTGFIPYEVGGTSIKAYKKSEYFSVIKSINSLVSPPRRTCVYAELASILFEGDLSYKGEVNGGGVEPPMIGVEGDSNLGEYVETTFNQVEGVIEGDKVKRAGDRVYYLWLGDEGYTVTEFDLQTGKAEEKRSCTVEKYGGFYQAEMFLSLDCTTLYVMNTAYEHSNHKTYGVNTIVTQIDTATMQKTQSTLLTGSYQTARLINDTLLVTTTKSVSKPDYDEKSSYLPYYEQNGVTEYCDAEDIILPSEPMAMYTSLYRLQGEKVEMTSVLGSATVYANDKNVYFACGYNYLDDTSGYYLRDTELYQIPFREELGSPKGITISGWVNDKYSMDEYDGVFRIAVTQYTPKEGKREMTTSLYAYDSSDLSLVGKCENFEKDEEIKSVRFKGKKATVCTAKIVHTWVGSYICDPVFIFDLSDYKHITYTESEEISGYSAYMVDYGDTILGIGVNNAWNGKLELYREIGDKVEVIDTFDTEMEFSREFKSYFIDVKNNLVGIPVYQWSSTVARDQEEYFLFDIANGIQLVGKTEIGADGFRILNGENVRAVKRGDELFIFSSNDYDSASPRVSVLSLLYDL